MVLRSTAVPKVLANLLVNGNQFLWKMLNYTIPMKTVSLALTLSAVACFAQTESNQDRRVERVKGYHIISRPARTGETPPEVKAEKAEEDRRRHTDTDISNQLQPTREPELKPKTVTP